MHHDFVLHVKNTLVLSSGCFWVVVQYQAKILGISVKTGNKGYNTVYLEYYTNQRNNHFHVTQKLSLI